MQILQLPDTKCELKDFHGGGKQWSLVCYKDKIVLPKGVQQHVIDWHHTMLCHPLVQRESIPFVGKRNLILGDDITGIDFIADLVQGQPGIGLTVGDLPV